MDWDRTKFRRVIDERAVRRGLDVDLERINYLNKCLYLTPSTAQPDRTFYVGIGHGHDALAALAEGLTDQVFGVDPYIGGHGNDDRDRDGLSEIISTLGIAGRFGFEKTTIQEYLDTPFEPFDRVICNDVLHHIYVTPKLLTRTPERDGAIAFFMRLRQLVVPGGLLVVADIGRNGLRQWYHRIARPLGIATFRGNYIRKQPWQEWDELLQGAGWERLSLHNYVPYGLRRQRPILDNWLGRMTLCPKYILTYRNR